MQQESPLEQQPQPKYTVEGLPIVTQATIDSFPFTKGKNVSEKDAMDALNRISKDNPKIGDMIRTTAVELEEMMGPMYGSGYLTGAFTAYELLRRQGEAFTMEAVFQSEPKETKE